jgi:hypothetical protein
MAIPGEALDEWHGYIRHQLPVDGCEAWIVEPKQALIQRYDFRDGTEALAYRGNPIDRLEPLARAKIAIIHVIGDADDTVPVAENTAIVEVLYRKLGGEIRVNHKPGVGHHPHGLEDPSPVVEWVKRHTLMADGKADSPRER